MTSSELQTGGPTAGGNEFDDDIFDYGIDGENDPFSDNYKPANASAPKQNTKVDEELGLDEAIEVGKKPRVPRFKLDENLLLSAKGIPELRRKAKKHLKFKGKGHEYSDMERLLKFYQLWLDDMYPKAKFLDGMVMIEKLGHKKRIQSARMEWIDEGKPKSLIQDESIADDPQPESTENGEREKTVSRIAPIVEKTATERPKTPEASPDADMDDLYDATPRASRQLPAGGTPSLFGPADDGPPDDDMDALLAEQEFMEAEAAKTQPKPVNQVVHQDDFDDDLDALMAEEEMMQAASKPAAPVTRVKEAEIDEDIEAMAAEMGDDMW
ncbi:replication fork protection component Swi3-domain-containing protein [Calycina marina]|uniref:Chromosome segregation in meiosis protein n=1 Tax=Calycina marina TaxID=1763456 RepID=A0A9P7Z0S6_9HELO|nr:replication fork protection component Swi3-domain-containing protein [Calycina marina]